MTPAVKQLLIINIIFFLGSFLVPLASDLFSLHYIESNDFKLWQLITHMFMHDGIPHIAFNMFALVSFGSVLENMWGSKKFLFFYFSCGLGAALLQLGVNYYELHQTLSSVSNLNLEPNTKYSKFIHSFSFEISPSKLSSNSIDNKDSHELIVPLINEHIPTKNSSNVAPFASTVGWFNLDLQSEIICLRFEMVSWLAFK